MRPQRCVTFQSDNFLELSLCFSKVYYICLFGDTNIVIVNDICNVVRDPQWEHALQCWNGVDGMLKVDPVQATTDGILPHLLEYKVSNSRPQGHRVEKLVGYESTSCA